MLIKTTRLAAAVLAFSSLAAFPAHSAVTFKAVLNGEVAVIDPIATTNYRTRDFAYLVWDTLIAVDSKGNYRPQMLESFSSSDDSMNYTFKLRPGLVWSDGTPVTAEDCVASIKRWAARDGMGKQMAARTDSWQIIDERTFTLKLKEPFGYVIDALGKPSSNVPVMMPKRLAETEPNKAITEVVGSGPFLFRKDLWVPGDRMVFEKNPRYTPRDEPADGLAGGKRVNIDRLELVTMPDLATAVSALQTGEVDFIQRLPYDFLPLLKGNPDVVLDNKSSGVSSMMIAARPNHLQPPFDKVEVRRVLQVLFDQKTLLSAIGAPADQGMVCPSIFMCDAPFSSTALAERVESPSLEKAREMLRESGYNGEKIVVLDAADISTIHIPATVMADLMTKAGFNVEVQSSDWATVAQKRWSKKPISEGGWSLLPLQWEGYDLSNPMTNYGVAHNCTDGYAGWSCDTETTALMAEFIKATDPAERQKFIDQIQARAVDTVSIVLGGQFAPVNGYRANVKDMLTGTGIPIFWNLSKQQ